MGARLLIATLMGCVLATGLRACAGGGPEPIPFTYAERCIFLELRAGGSEDLLFLLDTGASASALDLKTVERLGLTPTGTVQVEGTTGTIEARWVRLPRLSTGKVGVDRLQMTAQDLSGSLAPPGRRLDGVLGADFLAHFAVTIDFEARNLTLATRLVRAGPAAGIAVPFTLDNGIPRLSGRLNGNIEADFRLDTGSSLFESGDVYLNVPETVWRRLRESTPTPVPERALSGRGSGGEVVLPLARIEELALGALVVPRPHVIVQPSVGYFARPDAVGFVSNNLLEKHSPVTVDYPRRKLYFSK